MDWDGYSVAKQRTKAERHRGREKERKILLAIVWSEWEDEGVW